VLQVVIHIMLASLTAAPSQVADRVETSSGIVERIASTVPGVRAFLGIPYAAPPIAAKRWTAPERPAAWTGVRKADTFGNRCIQTRVLPDTTWRSATESEDCLYLSIWTPAETAAPGLPVMVWIHGGGFNSGAGDEARYDGASLASRGVVLGDVPSAVEIQRRLGLIPGGRYCCFRTSGS
jgi:para-nitrobenzyl esterase